MSHASSSSHRDAVLDGGHADAGARLHDRQCGAALHAGQSLQASRDQITWVLTSYIVAAAIMTAPVGWIASRFGRKNFAIVSLGGFTITSMMCGAAQTLDQMIIFRLLQGAFGAALSPLSQSIMLDLYPPQKRGTVMAIWGMGVMVGPILGPTLGGYLTDAYDWRWVFYVNRAVRYRGGDAASGSVLRAIRTATAR